MGVGGTLQYLSDLLSGGHSHDHHSNKKKRKQFQTVELKVRMDCDGCELKVKKALSSMKGVQRVEINRKQQKVTVSGYVEANKVLKKAKSTGKKAEIWPYVPYNSTTYTAQAYDKKAPPGYVRNVELEPAAMMMTSSTSSSSYSSVPVHGAGGPTTRQDDQITNMFSDENPNSCSVM